MTRLAQHRRDQERGVYSQALRGGYRCEAARKSTLEHPYPTIEVCETGLLDVVRLRNSGCGKELASLVARSNKHFECSCQYLPGLGRIDEHERAAEPQRQPRRLRDLGLRQERERRLECEPACIRDEPARLPKDQPRRGLPIVILDAEAECGRTITAFLEQCCAAGPQFLQRLRTQFSSGPTSQELAEQCVILIA